MDEKPIILFDGVCNLCNGSVNFLIARDKQDRFRFGSLQSPQAAEILNKFNASNAEITTVILYEKGQLYYRSTAILKIFRKMGGLWPLLYALIIIPKFIRDPIYNLIAKNRYRIFGKKDTCMIPTPALRAKFI
ncbi:MAG TPA: thiol-disulfide oxidoreductase DCC family protein [Cyclobacteriaceae bacterium]|nr:thiol-disulfide oxidoreductase DCC family protein [Cyclobacteriaceae bacterium]